MSSLVKVLSSAGAVISNLAFNNLELNLCLPTFPRSYFLGSKNIPSIRFLAFSTLGGSPGLSLL